MTYSEQVNFEEARRELAQRLDALPHGERKRVAQEAGVTPGFITHIIKGRKQPNQELQSRLLRAMGYREQIVFVPDPTPEADA